MVGPSHSFFMLRSMRNFFCFFSPKRIKQYNLTLWVKKELQCSKNSDFLVTENILNEEFTYKTYHFKFLWSPNIRCLFYKHYSPVVLLAYEIQFLCILSSRRKK
jgi:hypothetical protein